MQEKQASQDSATVTVTMGDQKIEFDLAYLKSFDKTVFDATVDTSKSGPAKKTFGGVPLAIVLEAKGIALDGAKEVTFKAADGYASIVTAEEAKDKENIYLVYERDGKASGTKQNGGSGPIEIVMRKDTFSQRWCKFLMTIEVK